MPFLAEFLKTRFNRKHHVNVEVCIVVRVFQLINNQVIVLRDGRHAHKTEVSEGMANIQRLVGLQIHAAGAEPASTSMRPAVFLIAPTQSSLCESSNRDSAR